MSWHEYYREYLRSPHWQGVRKRSLARVGHRCERCGIGGSLQVHHKHYETLGRERVCDIEVLCPMCHQIADDERARTSAQRARYNGFETWLRRGDRENTEEEWDRYNAWRSGDR